MSIQTITSKLAAGIKQVSAAISEGINALSNKYFLQISYVSTPEKQGQVPELIKKLYLNYNSTTGASKVVDTIEEATCIDYTLGVLLVKKLRKITEQKNLQYDLITCADAALLEKIQKKP